MWLETGRAWRRQGVGLQRELNDEQLGLQERGTSMIFRQYGSKYHSVTPNFDPRALTEVGFRRDGQTSLSLEEMAEGYEEVRGSELSAQATAPNLHDAEQSVVRDMEAQVLEMVAGLAPEEILVIGNRPGVDHPKSHHERTNSTEGGRGYRAWVDPPLRITVFRRRALNTDEAR